MNYRKCKIICANALLVYTWLCPNSNGARFPKPRTRISRRCNLLYSWHRVSEICIQVIKTAVSMVFYSTGYYYYYWHCRGLYWDIAMRVCYRGTTLLNGNPLTNLGTFELCSSLYIGITRRNITRLCRGWLMMMMMMNAPVLTLYRHRLSVRLFSPAHHPVRA